MSREHRHAWRQQAHDVLQNSPESELQRLLRWATFVEAWMTDIDTALGDLANAISGVSQRVSDTQTALQTEINSLQAAGTDTTKLQSVADALEAHVAELNAIDPVASAAPATDATTGTTATADTTAAAGTTDTSASAGTTAAPSA